MDSNVPAKSVNTSVPFVVPDGQLISITSGFRSAEGFKLLQQSFKTLMISNEIHWLSATVNQTFPDLPIKYQCFHDDPVKAAAACQVFMDAHSDCTIDIHLNPIKVNDDLLIGREFARALTTNTPTFRRRRKVVFRFAIKTPNETTLDTDTSSATLVHCLLVVSVLEQNGWPEPLIVGNEDSTFAIYELDTPVMLEVTEYLKESLSTLSRHFDTSSTAIDLTTFEADSICCLYSPLTIQPKRSDHSWTKILNVPTESRVVEVSRLIDVATDFYWRRTHFQRFHAIHGQVTPRRLTLEDFLSLCRNVRQSSDGNYVVSCPAHHDTRPSMSVSQGTDGRILFCCHTGCSFRDICDALGIEPQQLFPANSVSTAASPIIKNTIADANLELHNFAHHCATTTSDEQLASLAIQLGVSDGSLRSLAVGWSPHHCAWAIPERRPDGSVVGIQLRNVEGNKWMVPGSHRGIILPWEWSRFTGKVFLPEGMSDVAALLSTGLQAIGRPAAHSSSALLVAALQSTEMMPVVVGENDLKPDGRWPGRDGAEKCARELSAALQRPVEIVYPPAGFKDTRQFIQHLNSKEV